jgi:hypothetical protein
LCARGIRRLCGCGTWVLGGCGTRCLCGCGIRCLCGQSSIGGSTATGGQPQQSGKRHRKADGLQSHSAEPPRHRLVLTHVADRTFCACRDQPEPPSTVASGTLVLVSLLGAMVIDMLFGVGCMGCSPPLTASHYVTAAEGYHRWSLRSPSGRRDDHRGRPPAPRAAHASRSFLASSAKVGVSRANGVLPK